jgi:hypothetical protein
VKEVNRSLTREKERVRVRAGFGGLESEERVEAVSSCMLSSPILSLADMTAPRPPKPLSYEIVLLESFQRHPFPSGQTFLQSNHVLILRDTRFGGP